MGFPSQSECVKLTKDQVTVVRGMEDRGRLVRRLATHSDVTEGSLRYGFEKVRGPERHRRTSLAVARTPEGHPKKRVLPVGMLFRTTPRSA